MSRVVTTPPANGLRADGTLPGGWWHDDPETGRIVCDLCPRACSLKPGDRGFCFVRQNLDGEMVLTTYGRSTGFCIDPIEKKPLNHFYPGTSVLSFGTAGCNLGCKFCQNWDISKSREVERLSEVATPEAIAEAARKHGCRSVAFTYNDPVIWAEYAIETARACRAAGIKTVAVTAGYITPEARGPFYEVMDAANVDLKGFTEEFYQHITYSHLQPVLDTLDGSRRRRTSGSRSRTWSSRGPTTRWTRSAGCASGSSSTAATRCRCTSRRSTPTSGCGTGRNTPHETLLEAYEVARREGLKYVYTGNVNDVAHQSTYCPHCGTLVIERDWYDARGVPPAGGPLRPLRRPGSPAASTSGRGPGAAGASRSRSRGSRAGPEVVHLNLSSHAMKPTTETCRARHARHRAPTPGCPDSTPEQHAADPPGGRRVRGGRDPGPARVLARPALAGAADVPVTGAYVTLKRQGHLRACCGFLGESRAADRGPVPCRPCARRPRTIACRRSRRRSCRYLDLSVNLLSQPGAGPGAGPRPDRRRARSAATACGSTAATRPACCCRASPSSTAGIPSPSSATSAARRGCPPPPGRMTRRVLFTFESVEFGGPFDATVLGPDGARTDGLFAPEDFRQLASHARNNLLALARGLTPIYYVPGIPDGNVSGLALTVDEPDGDEPWHYVQLSLRPGVPLQATLFRLCEHAAQVLRQALAGAEGRSGSG